MVSACLCILKEIYTQTCKPKRNKILVIEKNKKNTLKEKKKNGKLGRIYMFYLWGVLVFTFENISRAVQAAWPLHFDLADRKSVV